MNLIATAKRLRAKRPITNKDTTWNKRLKLTHKIQALKRRQAHSQHRKTKRQRINIPDEIDSEIDVDVDIPKNESSGRLNCRPTCSSAYT